MRTLGAVYVCIATLYLLLPLEGAAQVWFGTTWLTLAPAAALVVTLIARSRAAHGARVGWLLIALAAGAGLAGQILWNVDELIRHRPVPFPSLSFLLFMLYHPLLLAGILVSLRSGSVRRARVELALDGAVAWSVITLALLRLLFEPLRQSAPHLTLVDQFYIMLGQMAVHGALVGAGVMIVWRDSVLPPRTVAALVGVTVANSTANFMVLARLDPDPGRVGDPFDLAWLAGWALLIYAGVAGMERGPGAWTGTRAAEAARRVRSAVLPASLLLFGLLAVDLAVRGNGTLPTIITLGVVAVLLALRGAQALNSADREERERQELERSRGLVALSHTLAGAAVLEDALTTVCDWGRRLLAAESAWIERVLPDGSVHSRGICGGRPVEADSPHAGSLTAWLEGAAGRQVCTLADQAPLRGPEGRPVPARMWVAVAAIRFGGHTLGAIVVAQPDRALDDTELDLLGALADQAAIVIENGRLVEDARTAERSRLRAEKLATVGQLVAGVAHEINNPLASIRTAADLLAQNDGDEDTDTSVRLIQEEAGRAAAIVRGMLDFVRPGEIEVAAVDPDDLVRATLRLRAYEHSLTSIRVECHLGGLPPVRADRNRLQQVFVNLIVNAEQAMADSVGPRVLRIHGEADGERVAIHVEDTGEGILAQNLTRVFDPFFTTKGVGKGTGLGLSVSYGIVRELGGDITVMSERGAGTTFTLLLPRALATLDTTTERPEPDDAHATAPTRGLRILLVDDEANLRLLLARSLRRAGHAVDVAADGRAGLTALDGAPFDVIVTDLKMPDIDGIQFFMRLAETKPALVDRVLFMSGDTVGPDTREFLAGTGRPFLAKPFTLAEFARRVNAVAESSQVPVA